MGARLNERFEVIPQIVGASSTQTSQAGADTSTVTGSSVNVPGPPTAGLTYRYTVYGTKTGANAAMKVHLKIGATQVVSITAEANTASDWMAQFTVRFSSAKAQKVGGILLSEAEDIAADYAAGTVDCSSGEEMIVQIEAQHASDTVTAELVTVEKWIL